MTPKYFSTFVKVLNTEAAGEGRGVCLTCSDIQSHPATDSDNQSQQRIINTWEEDAPTSNISKETNFLGFILNYPHFPSQKKIDLSKTSSTENIWLVTESIRLVVFIIAKYRVLRQIQMINSALITL